MPGQISPSVPANEIRGSDAGQSNERGNWRISGETTDVVRPLAVTCPLLPRVRSSTSIKPPTLVTSILQLLPARPSSRHQVYLASSSWPSVPLLPVPAPVRASCTSWIPTGSGTTTGGVSSNLFRPRVQQDSLLTVVPRQDHRPQRMARSSVSSPQSPTIVWVLTAVPSRLITSSTNGFDGSLMNSLQSMNQWKSFFNNPQGGTLGLLNAIQVSESVAFVRL